MKKYITLLARYIQRLLSDDEADDAILRVLNKGGNYTGFDLHKATGLPFHRIYPNLNRMEKQGFVGSVKLFDEEFGLNRRYYFRNSMYWAAHSWGGDRPHQQNEL